jgi:site-specific DNA-adenine methylase
MTTLKAPFPYFGGKSIVAPEVWTRFGDVPNYVEPFFGSGAVLFARPSEPGIETINDADGFVSNFWRALQGDPNTVAMHADNPVNENDLHARHSWLVGKREPLTAKLEGDPFFYDSLIAGWWAWGLSCWIGSGWCSGNGPWYVTDGELRRETGDAGQGVNRKLPHLGDAGRGVNRQRADLQAYFRELSARLRSVRVCSGDWSRVCGPSPTSKLGITGVFLDPPYADTAKRESSLYAVDSESVAHDVRRWAIENGNNPLMRIALCGYDGEHEMPGDWEVHEWKARGGYESQGEDRENSKRERIWFSPHCLSTKQGKLF